MNSQEPEDKLFERLARESEQPDGISAAPPRLKARMYSALVRRQQESGPLRSLRESKAEGAKLCVFEETWTVAALSEKIQRLNLCRVCHARLLAEKMEKAPIYWPGCTYADFHKW